MAQHYEIRIRGHLDETWSDWLNGLVVHHEAGGNTVLAGKLPDQAALHGVLNRLRDMGVPLVSVNPTADARDSGADNSNGGP
ncbi:MAG: hypothetical protein IPM16_00705 [Chloroflexi bacterium]|nr:hypothetical protein [Chloroflexota bacterium]